MLIKVKAFPNSKEEEVIKKSADSFDVKVKEKPVQGLANKRIIVLLACYFEIPQENIRMVRGFKERNKLFEIKYE